MAVRPARPLAADAVTAVEPLESRQLLSAPFFGTSHHPRPTAADRGGELRVEVRDGRTRDDHNDHNPGGFTRGGERHDFADRPRLSSYCTPGNESIRNPPPTRDVDAPANSDQPTSVERASITVARPSFVSTGAVVIAWTGGAWGQAYPVRIVPTAYVAPPAVVTQTVFVAQQSATAPTPQAQAPRSADVRAEAPPAARAPRVAQSDPGAPPPAASVARDASSPAAAAREVIAYAAAAEVSPAAAAAGLAADAAASTPASVVLGVARALLGSMPLATAAPFAEVLVSPAAAGAAPQASSALQAGAAAVEAAVNASDVLFDTAAVAAAVVPRPFFYFPKIDALAAFNDAMAAFIDDSAAPAQSTQRTRARAWAITAAVLAADLALLAYWHRTRQKKQRAPRPPRVAAPPWGRPPRPSLVPVR